VARCFPYHYLYFYVSFPYIELGSIHWLMYRSRLHSQPQRSSNRTPLGDASFDVGRARRRKRRGDQKLKPSRCGVFHWLVRTNSIGRLLTVHPAKYILQDYRLVEGGRILARESTNGL
jgi:hypothetical protein